MGMAGSPFQFPEIWHTVALIASYLLFLPSLIVIISTTNEFNFKTHRQNVIDGLSRTEFIYGKMLLILVLSVAFTIVLFLTGVVFGLSEAYSYFSMENSSQLYYSFIQCISYTSLALLLSLLLKRSGLTIALFFTYVFLIENILVLLINRFATGDPLEGPGYYLTLDPTDKLVPIQMFQKALQKNFLPPVANLLIAAHCYIILYFVLIKRKFETADL
ncbi:hypothetical protein FLA_6422 [Filimonas lacunae]|nr:hypothetical protein FLA_6422 [Filimonas lacunae]